MNTEANISFNKNTARYQKKRDSIINIASMLFDKKGVKGTTLCEIAEEVGLNTNSITYYFRKKEDLFFECLMHTIKTFEGITEIAEKEKTPQERIKCFIKEFFKAIKESVIGNHPCIMAFRDAKELDEPYTKIVFAAYINMFKRVRNLFMEEEINSKNKITMSLRTHFILNQTHWARIWTSSYSIDSYETISFYITDIILNGLAVDKEYFEKIKLSDQVSKFSIQKSPNHDFLVSAINLINEFGYSGTSIDRISANLGVTKGSFYHHIPRRENLFAECIQQTKFIVRGIQKIILEENINGLEKLVSISRALIRFNFSEQGPLLRVSAWGETLDFTDFHEKIKLLQEFNQNLNNFLAKGMMDGSIRPTHQSIAAMMIIGVINGALTLNKWIPGAENINIDFLYTKLIYCGLFKK